MRTWGAAAVVVAVLALSGCAPAAPSPPMGYSEDQVNAVMAVWAREQSDRYAGHILGRLPEVRFVEFLPKSVWVRTLLACERRLDGVSAQVTLYDNASDYARAVCGIQLPPPQLRDRIRSPAQLAYLWDFYRADLAPCLRGFGVSVTGMPTRAQFRASSTGGIDAWDPFEHLESRYGTTSGLSRAITTKCPAAPPGMVAPARLPDFQP